MKNYIGTKTIKAEPEAKGGTPGYKVVYPDGYTSWSPKDVFEAAYRISEGEGQRLTFGDAIHFLKLGHRVARSGWNGKGMWISMSGPPHGTRMVSGGFWSENNRKFAEERGGSVVVLPAITMKTATDEILMGWLASQTDMLAEDWQIVQ